MIRTNEDLQRAILKVVAYNWPDELRDFEECLDPKSEKDPEGHVFLTLRDLAEWYGAKISLPHRTWERICQRCGTSLRDGLCGDETCPYSDHGQGWTEG